MRWSKTSSSGSARRSTRMPFAHGSTTTAADTDSSLGVTPARPPCRDRRAGRRTKTLARQLALLDELADRVRDQRREPVLPSPARRGRDEKPVGYAGITRRTSSSRTTRCSTSCSCGRLEYVNFREDCRMAREQPRPPVHDRRRRASHVPRNGWNGDRSPAPDAAATAWIADQPHKVRFLAASASAGAATEAFDAFLERLLCQPTKLVRRADRRSRVTSAAPAISPEVATALAAAAATISQGDTEATEKRDRGGSWRSWRETGGWGNGCECAVWRRRGRCRRCSTAVSTVTPYVPGQPLNLLPRSSPALAMTTLRRLFERFSSQWTSPTNCARVRPALCVPTISSATSKACGRAATPRAARLPASTATPAGESAGFTWLRGSAAAAALGCSSFSTARPAESST